MTGPDVEILPSFITPRTAGKPRPACADTDDPELWFPVSLRGRPRKIADARGLEAKAICLTCPVRAACLDYALANDERGIWGALDDRERDALRRKAAARAS